MKRTFAAVICLGLLIPVSGCYYLFGQYAADQLAAQTELENARARAFVGRHQDELLKVLGAPTQTLDDTKGGRIWVYTQINETVQPARSETSYNPDTKSSTTTTYPSQSSRTTSQAMYWVHANGTIYNASWKRF